MKNLFMVVANYQICYMSLLIKYERVFLFEGYASVFDPAADSMYATFINEGVELADYTFFTERSSARSWVGMPRHNFISLGKASL